MRFYDYEFEIKKEFESKSIDVDMYYDSPVNASRFDKAINNKVIEKNQNQYLDSITDRISGKEYDLMLVIVGRSLTELFFEKINKYVKIKKKILYLWDDVARVENFNSVKTYYDEIYTFDQNDSKSLGLRFLPLFYCNRFKTSKNSVNSKKTIDIYGLFWNHSDRIEISKRLIKKYPKKRIKFIFIVDGRKNLIRMSLKYLFTKEMKFTTKRLSSERNMDYLSKSRMVLDIQHPSQNGLTIRTLECLASKKKIITTNENIKNYDFYNDKDICIIDRKNPELPDFFLEDEETNYCNSVIEKYSITNWVSTLLSNFEKC